MFASDTRWTVVRGSDLEEGESQGLPVWSRHVGDPILESNLTRRMDFALFMVAALENDELVHEAPAIVGRQTPSALAHATGVMSSTSREPARLDRRDGGAHARHHQPTRPGVAAEKAGISLGRGSHGDSARCCSCRPSPFSSCSRSSCGWARLPSRWWKGTERRPPPACSSTVRRTARAARTRSGHATSSSTVSDRLAASLWYPAAPKGDREPRLTYAYELKLFAPLGTVAIATHEGQATRNTPYDLSAAPYPLVVLSPGYAIGSTSYAWLAEHLASYGLVVISPEPDEDLNPARIWRSTITRPQDIRSLVAYVEERVGPGGAFEELVDRSRLAVIGHSYGGYTALAAAGARLDTDAFEARCRAEYATDGPNTWLCDALVPHLAEMAELAGLDDAPDSSLAGPGGAWGGRDRVDGGRCVSLRRGRAGRDLRAGDGDRRDERHRHPLHLGHPADV